MHALPSAPTHCHSMFPWKLKRLWSLNDAANPALGNEQTCAVSLPFLSPPAGLEPGVKSKHVKRDLGLHTMRSGQRL